MEVKLPDAYYGFDWNGWSIVLCRRIADQLGLTWFGYGYV